MPLARALQAQRTFLLQPRHARGKAPLAFALQVRRVLPPQQRPPGLNHPRARGSARQSGRKRPTKESPIFESIIDSAAVPGTRTLGARISSTFAPATIGSPPQTEPTTRLLASAPYQSWPTTRRRAEVYSHC